MTVNHEKRGRLRSHMWGETDDSVAESRVPENIPTLRIFSCLVPSYLPSATFSLLAHAHHPPALCTPPQKSSDSWKVLGVYSVTTKQNHLKTKWAGECATAIRPSFLCGRREKRPLRIMGTEGGQGDAHHFNPQVIPLSTHPGPLQPPPPLHPTHTHTFKCSLQR